MNTQPKGLEEGIYFDLSNNEYHNDPAIGSTDIKKLLKSPTEYWYNSNLNPNNNAKKAQHLKFGSAMHCYLMERHNFHKEFQVLPEYSEMRIDSDFYNRVKDEPDFSKNFQLPKTKSAKQIKYIGEKPRISHSEYDSIRNAVAYLRLRQVPSRLFESGYPEVSIFWRDEETGLMCKCRHDYLNIKYSADYKSISDLSLLERQIKNYKYHVSSSFYLEGLKKVKEIILRDNIGCPDDVEINWWHKFLEIEHDKFIFVFQEKEAPFRIRCRALHSEVDDIAQDQIRKGLNIYKYNIEKYGVDLWPDDEDQEIKVLDLYDLPYIGGMYEK